MLALLSNNLWHTLATTLITVRTEPWLLVENLCTTSGTDATGRRWRILFARMLRYFKNYQLIVRS